MVILSAKVSVEQGLQTSTADLLRSDLCRMVEALYKDVDVSWNRSSRYLLCLLIVGLCAAIGRILQFRTATANGRTKTTYSDNQTFPIIPLEGFNWEKTEPLQFRPFKGKDKYNLTMGKSLLIQSDTEL